MRMLCFAIAVTLGFVLPAGAQPPAGPPPGSPSANGPGPPPGAPPGPPAEPTPAPPEQAPPALPEGDIVHLENGKQLVGVQVLRETPTAVEVLAMEGVPPLALPRTQVKKIIYDDIDPNQPGWSKKKDEKKDKLEVILGEEVSAEFHRKLTKPLTEDQPLKYENEGYVRLLTDLAKRADVALEVAEPAKQIPVEKRKASFTIKPGTSLLTFLQNTFLKDFPQLGVKIQFDKIILTSKKAAAEGKNDE